MSEKVKARTRGYIKDTGSGMVVPFLFNPEGFSDSHGVTYKEMASPGGPYPKFHFVRGQSKAVEVELFLFGHNGEVKKYVAFLNNFLCPAKTGVKFTPPPTLIYAFGWYVKECILETLAMDYSEFDSNLNPVKAIAKLSLKAV